MTEQAQQKILRENHQGVSSRRTSTCLRCCMKWVKPWQKPLLLAVFFSLVSAAGCQRSDASRQAVTRDSSRVSSAADSSDEVPPDSVAPRRSAGRSQYPPYIREIYDHFLRAHLFADEASQSSENAAEFRELELAELRQASRLEPESGYIRALIADRLYRLSRHEEAEREARQALRKDPSSVLACLVLGKIHLQQQRMDLAIDWFEKCLSLEPHHQETLFHLARIYQDRNDLQKVNEIYLRLIEINPDQSHNLYPMIAQNYLLDGDYPKAIEFYERTIRVAPFYTPAYRNMAYAYFRQENYDKAIEIYRRLLSLERAPEGKAEIEGYLAETFYRAGKMDQAYQSFLRSLQLDPRRQEVRRPLGLLAYYLGKYSEAVQHLSEYIKVEPDDWEVLQHLGVAYVEMGRIEEATAILERIRQEGLASAQVYHVLVQLYSALGQPDQVEQVLLEAIEKGENLESLLLTLGVFQYEQHRYEQAEEQLLKVLELNPTNKQAQLYLGLTYDKLDRMDLLEKIMRQAIALDNQFAEALNLLGYAFADRNMNLDEAERLIDAALVLRPNAGFIVDSLGWVYYRQGRYSEAVEQLERAVRLTGDSPDWVILDHLGDAYIQLGRVEDAVNAWTKALEARPHDRDSRADKIQNDIQEIQAKIQKATAKN